MNFSFLKLEVQVLFKKSDYGAVGYMGYIVYTSEVTDFIQVFLLLFRSISVEFLEKIGANKSLTLLELC